MSNSSHLKMSNNLMRSQQCTACVVEVGAGVGAGVVVGAEVKELLQGASLERLLPGNTRFTSCMTVTLPPTTRSLKEKDYIKSGWLTNTPRLRGSDYGGCASTRPPCVLTNIKEW